MTILIANFRNKRGGVDAIAVSAWAVIPNVGGKTCTMAQDIFMSHCLTLNCTFDEFCAAVADGGKIVDVRHLQEPK